MGVRLVARKEVTYVAAEAAEADLLFQPELASLREQLTFQRSVAEDVERHCAARFLRFGEDPQEIGMVLDRLEVTNGHEVGEWRSVARRVVRRDEVMHDGVGDGC